MPRTRTAAFRFVLRGAAREFRLGLWLGSGGECYGVSIIGRRRNLPRSWGERPLQRRGSATCGVCSPRPAHAQQILDVGWCTVGSLRGAAREFRLGAGQAREVVLFGGSGCWRSGFRLVARDRVAGAGWLEAGSGSGAGDDFVKIGRRRNAHLPRSWSSFQLARVTCLRRSFIMTLPRAQECRISSTACSSSRRAPPRAKVTTAQSLIHKRISGLSQSHSPGTEESQHRTQFHGTNAEASRELAMCVCWASHGFTAT